MCKTNFSGWSPSKGQSPYLEWSPIQLIKHELRNSCSGIVLVSFMWFTTVFDVVVVITIVLDVTALTG